MLDKFPLLKSRKFQLVLTTAAGIVSSVFAGAVAPEAALYSIVALVLGLVASIAWEDVSKRGDIFDKARKYFEQADEYLAQADRMWDTAGELLTRVEEIAGTIEAEKPE